jgi:trigger factor
MSLIQKFNITENNRALFEVNINNNEYLALVSKFESEYLQTIQVDGFRPGKVPKEVAMKNVNPLAFQAFVIEKVINSNSELVYKEAEELLKAKNRIMIRIAINDSESKGFETQENGDFVYHCEAKLLPEIKLDEIMNKAPKAVDLSGFPKLEEYQKEQETSFLKEMNEFEESSEKAKEGDKVTLTFDGTLDGVSLPSLKAESYTIVLGSKEFLEDFEKEIYGMKKDEEKTFKVKFPADYFSPEMASKTVEFTAKILKLEIAKFSSIKEIIESSEQKKEELGSEENIQKYIVSRYEDEKTNYQASKEKEAFMDFLITETPDFSLSSEEVNKQTESIFGSLVDGSKESNMKIGEVFVQAGLRTEKKDILNLDPLDIRKEVERNVREELKLQYIYLAVIYTQKIQTPDPKILETYLKQISASPRMYGFPEGLKQEELSDMLMDKMMKSEAFNWLIANTKKAI